MGGGGLAGSAVWLKRSFPGEGSEDRIGWDRIVESGDGDGAFWGFGFGGNFFFLKA